MEEDFVPPAWMFYISLIVSVLTLPVYLLVVTLYIRKPQLKRNVANWLQANIGILDCLFLTINAAGWIAVVSRIIQETLYLHLVHCIYRRVLPWHLLLLTLNRAVAISGFKCKHEETITKIGALLTWTWTLPPIYLLGKSFCTSDGYCGRSTAKSLDELISVIWMKSGLILMIVTLLCHLIVIAVVFVKMLECRGEFKMKTEDARLHIQALAMFIPALLCYAYDSHGNSNSALYSLIELMSLMLIPTANLLICLALNRTLRATFFTVFSNSKSAIVINHETEQNVGLSGVAAVEEKPNLDMKSGLLLQQA